MTQSLPDLFETIDPVTPDMIAGDVYERFSANSDLLTLAVVENDRPLGLVNRHELFLRLADTFGRPLYENKPISNLMDDAPLIVDANVSIEALSAIILTERPGALMTGFIVTRDDRYLGIGTALSLLRRNVDRMKQRQAQLDHALHESQRANEAKSTFLANMSHELRTPLNAVIGFSEVIKQGLYGPVGSPQYVQYADDIHQSGRHLLDVINDLLDISKVESGAMELEISQIILPALIEDCVRMTRQKSISGRVNVVVEAADDLPPIEADEFRLRQVLLNLLSNALKFTEPGGSVVINARHFGDRICLNVIDTGIGMAPEDIPRALSPFSQVDNGLSRKFEGTGLGLPISRSLVELHGGSLRIDSRPKVGTTIAVELPLFAPSRSSEQPSELQSRRSASAG